MRILPAVILLATASLTGCGGPNAEADSGQPAGRVEAGSARSAAVTDMSAVVIEMGGQRWTGMTCPQKVVRVFRNPSTGGVPMVPAICTMPGRLIPSIELMVQGSLVNFETGTWTGDALKRRIAVEFEADGFDLDTRRDVIDQASRLTISTWDAEGIVEGELDLIVTSVEGTGKIRGPFTIAFEVQ